MAYLRKTEDLIGLLEGEEVLFTIGDGAVVLTNYRFRYEREEGGFYCIQSVTLDAVTSCQFLHISEIGWLILGCIFIVGGIAALLTSDKSNAPQVLSVSGVTLCVLGFLSIVKYFRSIQCLAEIASPSVDIRMPAQGNDREEWLDLFQALEEAKLNLISTVYIGTKFR